MLNLQNCSTLIFNQCLYFGLDILIVLSYFVWSSHWMLLFSWKKLVNLPKCGTWRKVVGLNKIWNLYDLLHTAESFFAATQEISRIMRNLKFHYPAYKSPALVAVLIHIYPIHNFHHIPSVFVCTPLALSPTSDQLDNIWWSLQVMKLLILQFFQIYHVFLHPIFSSASWSHTSSMLFS